MKKLSVFGEDDRKAKEDTGQEMAGGSQQDSQKLQKIAAFGADEDKRTVEEVDRGVQYTMREESIAAKEEAFTEREVDRGVQCTVREEAVAVREEAVTAREEAVAAREKPADGSSSVMAATDSAGRAESHETPTFSGLDTDSLTDGFQEEGNLDDADLNGILGGEQREEPGHGAGCNNSEDACGESAYRDFKRTLADAVDWLDQSSFKDMAAAAASVPAVQKAAAVFKHGFIGILNKSRVRSIIKGFENGAIVESGQFTFAKNGASLMLMKYSGIDKSVVVPATVGGAPVQFIHPDFLSGGMGVLNNHRVRGVLDMAGAGGNSILDTDDVLMSGFSSLILPNTVTMIFSKTFVGCHNLKSLCIPASVYYLDNNAFKHSRVQELYFNGSCPKGFSKIPEGCSIFVRREYEQEFRRCCL